MLAPTQDQPAGPAGTLRCSECDAALAYDQRYCLDCGARRGPLPSHIAATIATILKQGRLVPAAHGPAAGTEASDAPRPASLGDWMPAPRAAAVAILSMLGFGVIVGSVVGSGVARLASSPLLLAVSPASTQAGTPGAGGSGGGGSGGSGGSGGGGGAGSGGGAAASAGAGGSAGSQTAQPGPTGSGTSPAPGSSGSGGGSGNSGLLSLPPIKHVFLIVLSDQGYSTSFGSSNKYFAKTVRDQGELIEHYYAVTGGELANEIALISGQGPTVQTATDCPVFADVSPAGRGKLGQVLGNGCVYPARTHTLADQLSAPKHGGWKAYVEGIDKAPAGQPTSCRHPLLGGNDANQAPLPTDPYVTWRNPFVYFHSLIDGAPCVTDDVGLSQLRTDLQTTSTTPALADIIPGPCDDGNDQPCVPGGKSGLAPAENFLKTVVPEIERSPAYKADGLIAVTFDQAPQTGSSADPSACCDPQTFPNLPGTTQTPGTTTSTTPGGTTTTTPGTAASTTTEPATTAPPPITTPTTTAPAPTTPTPTTPTTTTPTPTTPTTTTPTATGGLTTPTGGGGQVGLLLISRYVKPGSLDSVDYYNHFSLLATIEDMFGVPKLGYAGDPALPAFDAAIFNAKR